MVPCIYTNTTFCDASEGAAAKVAAGRWFHLFTCWSFPKEYQPKKTLLFNQSLITDDQSRWFSHSVPHSTDFDCLTGSLTSQSDFVLPVLASSWGEVFFRRSLIRCLLSSSLSSTNNKIVIVIATITKEINIITSKMAQMTKSSQGELVSIDPSEFGSPTWALTLCLLAAWIIIFLCLVKVSHQSFELVCHYL